MRCLFVGRDYKSLDDGGKIVTKRNVDFLKHLCSDVDEILRPKATLSTLLKNYLLLEGYGLTKTMKKQFSEYLRTKKYDFVWFDGSCDRTFVKYCKLHAIPSIVFYHNVETSFYLAKASATGSLKDRLFSPYISSLEKYVSENSTYRIMLNERDGDEINKLYNCTCDLILPTSFEVIKKEYLESLIKEDESYLLFVGSNFWANEEGLKFFFSDIAPYITDKVKIVGSICDAFKNTVLPDNIELVGRVGELDKYYANAKAIISPILSGSGTKTKTIEALRYGKTIVGSPESMMGVPAIYYSKICSICYNAEDYITAIKNLPPIKLNPQSLLTFHSIFSTETVFKNISDFIKLNIGANQNKL